VKQHGHSPQQSLVAEHIWRTVTNIVLVGNLHFYLSHYLCRCNGTQTSLSRRKARCWNRGPLTRRRAGASCLTRLSNPTNSVIWNRIKVLNNPLWLGYPVWFALLQKLPNTCCIWRQRCEVGFSRVLPTSQQNSTAGVQSLSQQWRSSNPQKQTRIINSKIVFARGRYKTSIPGRSPLLPEHTAAKHVDPNQAIPDAVSLSTTPGPIPMWLRSRP
jgi:hypothetical protein